VFDVVDVSARVREHGDKKQALYTQPCEVRINAISERPIIIPLGSICARFR
jgi:hypothetical protein